MRRALHRTPLLTQRERSSQKDAADFWIFCAHERQQNTAFHPPAHLPSVEALFKSSELNGRKQPTRFRNAGRALEAGILAKLNCVGSLSGDVVRSLQPPTAQRFGLGLLKTQFNTAAPDGVFDPLDREGLFSQLS